MTIEYKQRIENVLSEGNSVQRGAIYTLLEQFFFNSFDQVV
jgi:hypothetical protein